MDFEFRLPKLGEGIEEASVVSIDVSKGDAVEPNQHVIVVEANAVLMPVPIDQAGTVLQVLVAEGDKINAGQAILILAIDNIGAGESRQPTRQIEAKTPRPESNQADKPTLMELPQKLWSIGSYDGKRISITGKRVDGLGICPVWSSEEQARFWSEAQSISEACFTINRNELVRGLFMMDCDCICVDPVPSAYPFDSECPTDVAALKLVDLKDLESWWNARSPEIEDILESINKNFAIESDQFSEFIRDYLKESGRTRPRDVFTFLTDSDSCLGELMVAVTARGQVPVLL